MSEKEGARRREQGGGGSKEEYYINGEIKFMFVCMIVFLPNLKKKLQLWFKVAG